MTVAEIVRDWLTQDCDVPGCDEEPEPLWIDGGLAMLCFEHAAEYLAHVADADDETDRVSCWRCGYRRPTYESCPRCGGSCKPLTRLEQQREGREAIGGQRP